VTTTVTADQISLFLLVVARVGGLMVSAPILGDSQAPRMVKVTIALALSFVLVQVPSVAHDRAPAALASFVLVVLAQLLIGIALGFIARLLFFVVTIAGQLVSLQVGLSNAAVFNPMTRESDPVLAQFYTVIAALTFLALNGDVWLVASLARSFDLSPVSGGVLPPDLLKAAITAAITATGLGLQIALPIAGSLFAANIVLGVVGRSLPQLNIFVNSMPLNFLLGLTALLSTLAATMLAIHHLTNELPQTLLTPLMGHH
jgi:flagellar biosynthesis protein FliR